MSKPNASPTNQTTSAIGAVLAAVGVADGKAPDWITIFPQVGPIECRDGRRYTVDAAALTAAFAADGISLPIDVDHALDAQLFGANAPAVGWVEELRVEGAALKGRVDWTEDGRALLTAKKYRYLSPDFWHDKDGRTTRLRAISLINAPALAGQPALASAQTTQTESSMKTIAPALGLSADATEAACLAALNDIHAKLKDAVAKGVYDEAVASLAARTKELADLRKTQRDGEVSALLEAALAAKKILPAEKDHYAALCATDDGLAAVKALLEARGAVLPASGLDNRKQPEGGAQSAAQLAASAQKLVAEARARGTELSIADAMTQVVGDGAAA